MVAGTDFAHPLRVLLDARKLGDGGIGVYLTNLVDGFLAEESARKVDITLLVHPEDRTASKWSEDLSPQITTRCRPYSLAELTYLGRSIDWSKFDLFHTPHYPLPMAIPVPRVVTVHDTIHFTHPEKFYYPLLAWPLIARTLACAEAVITVSHASATALRGLGRLLPGAKAPITVIPNALAHRSAAKGPALSKEELSSRTSCLAVVSTPKPHKRIDRIIAAFLAAHATGSLGAAVLHLVGYAFVGSGWERLLAPELFLAYTDAVNKGTIVVHGAVSDTCLQSMFEDARLLLVGADIEGFCIPVLEAHAVGVPVVSTPIPAVVELLGGNDKTAVDFTVAGLKQALVEAWGNPQLAAPPDDRYTPRAVAAATLAVYRQAVLDRAKG